MRSEITKPLIGLAMAFGVGFVCSVFAIPSPSPPVIIGALIVMGMTVGYMLVDRVMSRPAVHAEDCGGTDGNSSERRHRGSESDTH